MLAHAFRSALLRRMKELDREDAALLAASKACQHEPARPGVYRTRSPGSQDPTGLRCTAVGDDERCFVCRRCGLHVHTRA